MNSSAYKNHIETQLSHRYIHNEMIEPLLKNLPRMFHVFEIGKSVQNRTIYAVKVGSGKKKLLFWSQMHGNESTTTKAMFDLFHFFRSQNDEAKNILDNCSLTFIPILNPDGAFAYTRVNANAIDLNRDAKNLSQPESLVLRKLFDEFKPDFCFNLHGQRTIFSAGPLAKPATVSFLAPAENKARTVTITRQRAMEVIAVLNTYLQKLIPGQIGIYDDTFNDNCVGDTFQSLGAPTILFEAGHYHNDYAREKTRGYILSTLSLACYYIATHNVSGQNYEPYFNIPENKKCFLDIIIRNAKISKDGVELVTDLGFMYQERLFKGQIVFKPILEKIKKLDAFFGHKEYNANNHAVLTLDSKPISVGYENDFVLINNEKYSLKLNES